MSQVASKIEAIKSLDALLKGLDIDELIENVKSLETFNLHVKHLFINGDKWECYQDAVGEIAADVRDLKDFKDRPAATTTPVPEASPSPDITELTAKIQDLSDQVEGFTLLQAQTVKEKSSTSIKDLEKICSTISKEVEKLATGTDDMGSKLKDLQSSVDTRSRTPSGHSRSEQPQEPLLDIPVAPEIHHGQTPLERSVENYISDEEAEDLTKFLQEQEGFFLKENGRTVLGYGEPYHYPGSKANKVLTEFPPIIQKLVDRINKDFNPPRRPKRKDGTFLEPLPAATVNQCLINKYTGSALIPEHSDDEPSIDPSSSIFTISIGAECELIFKEKSTGEQRTLNCNSASIYSMSRKSQEFYSHKIPLHELGSEVRYSLTFRRCHWSYKNAVLVVGDSLTSKLKFGTGKDTFGFTTPGTKEFAGQIEDIDPTYCSAFPNIVIMCGINSIRQDGVGEDEVRELYTQYKHKIEQIRMLNRNSSIYVCPIIPTKNDKLNKKAIQFNKLIYGDLCMSPSCYVVTIEGIADLLNGRTNRLCERLSFPGDDLHVNPAGARIIAKHIKRAMFVTNMHRRSARVHTSRSFAAVAGGVQGGRGAG